MGIVKSKEAIKREKVTFDFSGPKLFVPRSMRGGSLVLTWEIGVVFKWAADEIAMDPDAVVALSADDHRMRADLLSRARAAKAPDGINWSARAAKSIIAMAVRTVFPDPKSIKRADRLAYAEWQEPLDFESDDTAEIEIGQLDWLHDVLDKALDGGGDKATPGMGLETSMWLTRTAEYAEDLYERAIAAVTTREAKSNQDEG